MTRLRITDRGRAALDTVKVFGALATAYLFGSASEHLPAPLHGWTLAAAWLWAAVFAVTAGRLLTRALTTTEEDNR